MNIKSLLMASTACVGLLAGAYAADTSSTINLRKVVENGGIPDTGYVHVTANASSTAAGFTFDLPVPDGMTSQNIVGFLPVAYSVSGSHKPLNITRVGATVTVSGSNAASGTVAVGDVIRGIVHYQ